MLFTGTAGVSPATERAARNLLAPREEDGTMVGRGGGRATCGPSEEVELWS
jgi:hypothetical protein